MTATVTPDVATPGTEHGAPAGGVRGEFGPAPIRVTVVGPTRRADLALPATVPLTAVVPTLVRRIVGAAHDEPGSPDAAAGLVDVVWVLQRLGAAPFEPGVTVADAELVDGELLFLRPAAAPLAEIAVDDLADGLADAVGSRSWRWSPATTRAACLVLFAAVMVTVGVLLLRTGSLGSGSLLLAGQAVLIAALATGIAGRLAWTGDDHAATVVTGLAGTVFAALAGLLLPIGLPGVFAPSAVGVVIAGACVVCQTSALLMSPPAAGGRALWGTLSALAVFAVFGGCLRLFGAPAPTAASVTAVTGFLLAVMGPRAAVRIARLRVPVLPRSVDELQVDADPLPNRIVGERAGDAENWLVVMTVGGALVTPALVGQLVSAGWTGVALTAVLAVVGMLQARVYISTAIRAALLGAGCTELLLLGVLGAADPALGLDAVILGAALLGAVACVVASQRLPGARVLPVWGRIADIAETLVTVAVVPLMLQMLGVLAFLRGLFG